MLLLMFSLAGMPPTVGFYAKLAVLSAAVNAGQIWLAVVAVVLSLIGAFYYLRIVKLMYFDEPEGTASRSTARAQLPRRCCRPTASRCSCFGILPQPLMALCLVAIHASSEGPHRAFRRRRAGVRRQAAQGPPRHRAPARRQPGRARVHPPSRARWRSCALDRGPPAAARAPVPLPAAARVHRDPGRQARAGRGAPRHREARAARGDRLRGRGVDAPVRDPHRHRLHRRGDRAVPRAQADPARRASSTPASSSRSSCCRSTTPSPWCATAASPT